MQRLVLPFLLLVLAAPALTAQGPRTVLSSIDQPSRLSGRITVPFPGQAILPARSRSHWAEAAGVGGISSALLGTMLHHGTCNVLGSPDQACDLGTAMGGFLILALPGALIGGLIGAAISTS